MERILQGYNRVVAILATSEGKSLLYQLPTQLAGATTTVVLVSLVALKTGKYLFFSLRVRSPTCKLLWNVANSKGHY